LTRDFPRPLRGHHIRVPDPRSGRDQAKK